MDLERWKQLDSLLQSVLERQLEERDAFLREACAGDRNLEQELRSLLALEGKAGSFLQTPLMEATPEASTSLERKTISHYRIIEKLGDGGMGTVWKARDTRLNRYIALKALHAAKIADPERKHRFVQEARAASALNHPNIVTIHDIDQADGVDFIAMEFVQGKALDRLIPRKGLRLKEAIEYAIQVADALTAAHAAGIVHRDLKPANVMVTGSGCVKVLDFGLVKLTEKGGSDNASKVTSELLGTDEGMILGTVSYMSPEQAEGKRVDARSDIFSFGALLYEMITGRHAFPGDSMVSILSAVLRDDPKPAREIVNGIPRDLDKIVTRCLRKDPNQRYQHAGDLKIDLQQIDLQHAKEEPADAPRARTGMRPLWWLAVAVACVAASFAIGRWFRAPEASPPAWQLTQITRDAGLSQRPALSHDGKLVAYSSDAGQDGGMNLYVRQVAGGQPIRLTSDGAGNTWPDFSPDGSKIVYRSNRDGGGIYEIPAFGGQSRLLARNGTRPRYSPDGKRVAYWTGAETIYQTVPGTSSVWVVRVAGGQPQRLAPGLTAARTPIWSPDGKRLLLVGYTSARLYDNANLDWWLTPVDEGDGVKTGTYAALITSGLSILSGLYPSPDCWSRDTSRVIFSVRSSDAKNLWEIGLSPQTGKVTGVPRRLTAGAGIEEDVSCASGGALAFASRDSRSYIWSLPFDLNRGTPTGASERITDGPAERGSPSLSKNARLLAFFSNQSGQDNIWKRDLATGNESIISSSSLQQRFPVVSPSGAKVAFGVNEEDGTRTVYVAAAGREPERVCEGCVRPTGWSSDEKMLLIFAGTPYQINSLDIATHRQTPLLKHPRDHILYGRFSPDDRWISFTVRTSPTHAHVAIAPFNGSRPIPESAWITIADVWTEDWANWSPDGRTLYFPSERDGHRCLWGQRMDAVSHRPVGEPFAAWHFHGRTSYAYCCQDGFSATAGRIAIALKQDTGNIWLMSHPGTR